MNVLLLFITYSLSEDCTFANKIATNMSISDIMWDTNLECCGYSQYFKCDGLSRITDITWDGFKFDATGFSLKEFESLTSLLSLSITNSNINSPETWIIDMHSPSLLKLILRNNGFVNAPLVLPYSLYELDLSMNQFNGNANVFSYLRFLTNLNLSNNKFSGNFSITNSIRFLDISDNEFSGSLTIGSTILSVMHIRYNQFTSVKYSTLPYGIDDCDIEYNQFSDNSLSSLRMFSCNKTILFVPDCMILNNILANYNSTVNYQNCCDQSYSEAVGCDSKYRIKKIHLPNYDLKNVHEKVFLADWQLLTSLTDLDLSNNQITEFPQLPLALETLNLSNNSIATSFDSETWWPQPLNYLNLSSNQFTGDFNTATNIETIDVSNNQFGPALTISQGSLRILIIENNKFEDYTNHMLLRTLGTCVIDVNPFKNDALEQLKTIGCQFSKENDCKMFSKIMSNYNNVWSIDQCCSSGSTTMKCSTNKNIIRVTVNSSSLRSPNTEQANNPYTMDWDSLGNLTYLDLSYNSLTRFPKLPMSLNVLYIQNNIIDSSFDQVTELAKDLREINISNNQFKGEINIPSSVQSLDASHNMFTESLVVPQNIKSLNVSNNVLGPDLVLQSTAIESMVLKNNLFINFTSSSAGYYIGICNIDDNHFNLTSLINLNDYNCQPTNDDCATLKNILKYNYSPDLLLGVCCSKSEIGCDDDNKIKSIDFSGKGLYNNDAGTAQNWNSLNKLMSLDLSHNNITVFPLPITQDAAPEKLTFLNIENNQISGNLYMHQIVEIHASYNQFDYIYDSFGNIGLNIKIPKTLKNLTVAHNNIKGDVPVIQQFDHDDVYIDISYNKFVSFNLNTAAVSNPGRGVVYFDASHNNIQQNNIGKLLSGSSTLQYLDLSFNNISGQFPPSLTSLKSLVSLYLQFNQFTAIYLATSKRYDVIDISHNNISSATGSAGTIQLAAGGTCDVSFNLINIEENKYFTPCKKICNNYASINTAYFSYDKIIVLGKSLIGDDPLCSPFVGYKIENTAWIATGPSANRVEIQFSTVSNPPINANAVMSIYTLGTVGPIVHPINPFIYYSYPNTIRHSFSLPLDIKSKMGNADKWTILPFDDVKPFFSSNTSAELKDMNKDAIISVSPLYDSANSWVDSNINYYLTVNSSMIPGFIRLNVYNMPVFDANPTVSIILSEDVFTLSVLTRELLQLLTNNHELKDNGKYTTNAIFADLASQVNVNFSNPIYSSYIQSELYGTLQQRDKSSNIEVRAVSINTIGVYNKSWYPSDDKIDILVTSAIDTPWQVETLNYPHVKLDLITDSTFVKSSIRLNYTCGAAKVLNVFNAINKGNKYEICAQCPDGATCFNNGNIPINNDGYHMSNVSGVLEFVPCMPSKACLAASTCSEGYKEPNCGICDAGYYKKGLDCVKCVGSFTVEKIALVAIAAILIVVLLLFLKLRYGSLLIVFSILFQYFQLLYIYKNLLLSWSDQVIEFFSYLSIFSFNLELAQPECVDPNINYFTKAKAMMAIPPIFLLCIIVFMAGAAVVDWLRHANDIGLLRKIGAYLYTGLAIFHLFLQIIYLSLCSWILGYFSCKEFGTDTVMVRSIGISCRSVGYKDQSSSFVLGVLVYVVGIPAYFSLLYWAKHQSKHKHLKKIGTAWLYTKFSDFNDQGQYIIAIHLILKCLIVCCQAFLNDVIILQAILVMLLIFTYLGFLIHSKPYLKRQYTVIAVFCQVCSIITLSCGIMFYVLLLTNYKGNIHYQEILTDTVIGTTCVLCFVAVWQVVKDLNNYDKKSKKVVEYGDSDDGINRDKIRKTAVDENELQKKKKIIAITPVSDQEVDLNEVLLSAPSERSISKPTIQDGLRAPSSATRVKRTSAGSSTSSKVRVEASLK
eukprot:NODE_28_length_33831_cov_0.361200.p1 type:complete len:1876 gc:universal NODE_28_length_33831_cov_0.361200:12645-7018(-)